MEGFRGLSPGALDPGSDVLAETRVWHGSSDAFWGVLGLQVPLGVRSTGWDRSQGGGRLDSHAQQRFQPHPPKVSKRPQYLLCQVPSPMRPHGEGGGADSGALELKHSRGNNAMQAERNRMRPTRCTTTTALTLRLRQCKRLRPGNLPLIARYSSDQKGVCDTSKRAGRVCADSVQRRTPRWVEKPLG
jgi:hypothetical protein